MGIYKKQVKFFSRAYEGDETPWPREKPTPAITKFFTEFIRKEMKSGKMLDIGCGEGRHSLFFSQNKFYSIGVDYLLTPLKKAIRKRKKSPAYVNGDMFSLPFKDHLFDIVLDSGCFHHVKKCDTKKYLNVLDNLLSERGFYILSCFSYKFRHANEKRRDRDWLVHKGHYDRFFTKKSLNAIFGPCYKILQIKEEIDKPYVYYHMLCRKKVTTQVHSFRVQG